MDVMAILSGLKDSSVLSASVSAVVGTVGLAMRAMRAKDARIDDLSELVHKYHTKCEEAKHQLRKELLEAKSHLNDRINALTGEHNLGDDDG